MMRTHFIYLILVCVLACIAAALACCSSDPAGPVVEQFVEDGTYGVHAGSTFRYVEEVIGRTVSFPLGVGWGLMLQIGEIRDIRYEEILFQFDFADDANTGKTVARAFIDLPIRSVQDTLFTLDITLHELLENFEETDTITSIGDIAFDPNPIPDSLGSTIRTLDIEAEALSIDAATAQAWIDAAESAGVAMLWAEVPPSPGLIEMNAHELGKDPTTVRVEFTDGTADTFAAVKDYPIAVFDEPGGLDCVGGVATRMFFEFTLDGLPDSAMIQKSNLVLTVRGDNGMGATPGERAILGYSFNYVYNLYAPGISGNLDTLRMQVDFGTFDPYLTETLRMSLRGLIPDIMLGLRENAGLVLQSELEKFRVQRASFYTNSADSIFKPYIEIIYSFPAEFAGDGGS